MQDLLNGGTNFEGPLFPKRVRWHPNFFVDLTFSYDQLPYVKILSNRYHFYKSSKWLGNVLKNIRWNKHTTPSINFQIHFFSFTLIFSKSSSLTLIFLRHLYNSESNNSLTLIYVHWSFFSTSPLFVILEQLFVLFVAQSSNSIKHIL